MRWKSVALAGALVPAVAGCNIYRNAARNAVNEPHVVLTQHAIEHDLRRQAEAALRETCAGPPGQAYSEEYRAGFIDGYVDYLDRGGAPTLPAVPPARFTRHARYYTPEGHCLLQQYFVGFRDGQEVAVASGLRPYLTVPVLLPQVPAGPPTFTVAPVPTAPVPTMPPPRPPGTSDAPPVGPEVPAAGGAAPGVLPTPRSLPRAVSKLPALPEPPVDADPTPVPAAPPPPAVAIPVLPDDAPALPPNHVLPPPLPPNHPRPRN